MESVCAMYFSATGTTRKIVESIAVRLAGRMNLPLSRFDFTAKKARQTPKEFTAEQIVVFGMPVVAGRVPNLMLEYLDTVKGNGALVVPVVVFGNRSFDDALIELIGILSSNGFGPIAAGAFVAEHSFSDILAKGRPDQKDIQTAYSFADKVAEKIQGTASELDKTVTVRGQTPPRPYYQPRDDEGNPIDIRRVKPLTDSSACTDCKLCARVCPMQAINVDKVDEVPGVCMKCCACVKRCPARAKYFDDPGFLHHKRDLETKFFRRAEPEIFL